MENGGVPSIGGKTLASCAQGRTQRRLQLQGDGTAASGEGFRKGEKTNPLGRGQREGTRGPTLKNVTRKLTLILKSHIDFTSGSSFFFLLKIRGTNKTFSKIAHGSDAQKITKHMQQPNLT